MVGVHMWKRGECVWVGEERQNEDKTKRNRSKLDVATPLPSLSHSLSPTPPSLFHSPTPPTPFPSLPQVDKILKVVPRQRVTYLYSATMTKKVQKLQRASLHDPVKIEVSTKYVGQGSRVKVQQSYTYCLTPPDIKL